MVRLIREIVVAFTTFMLLGGGTGVIERISGTSTGLQWDNRIKYLVIPIAGLLSLALLVLVDIGKGRSWAAVAGADRCRWRWSVL